MEEEEEEEFVERVIIGPAPDMKFLPERTEDGKLIKYSVWWACKTPIISGPTSKEEKKALDYCFAVHGTFMHIRHLPRTKLFKEIESKRKD